MIGLGGKIFDTYKRNKNPPISDDVADYSCLYWNKMVCELLIEYMVCGLFFE